MTKCFHLFTGCRSRVQASGADYHNHRMISCVSAVNSLLALGQLQRRGMLLIIQCK